MTAGNRLITDDTRSGKPWQQALIGVLGIVLALVLVAGQISVATTRGIADNMRLLNANLEEGNEVMFEIVKKSAPAPVMEKVVNEQSGTLAHTRDSLVLMNEELDAMMATTDELQMQSQALQGTAGEVAGTVQGMEGSIGAMIATLGTLPTTTASAGDSLSSVRTDSAAINAELEAVGTKLEKYGLPKARGDR